MLGLTSYQEALRAIGRLAEASGDLHIVEHPDSGSVEVSSGAWQRDIDGAELEDIVITSVAHRGEHVTAGEVSDVLRSVGLALDELHALNVCLVLKADGLEVRYADRQARRRELSYPGEELEALRRAAAGRRNGQPLRRIVILQASPESGAPLVELLVAEFAVQALPTPYARAIAATAEPPDLVLAQAAAGTLDAVRTLRAGKRTAEVPILVLASEAFLPDAGQLFGAGADDVLPEPVQPAQLRARIRTSLLRAEAQ